MMIDNVFFEGNCKCNLTFLTGDKIIHYHYIGFLYQLQVFRNK